jgi:hypothetical protein
MPTGALQILGAGIGLLAGFIFVHLSIYRRYSLANLRTDRYALHVVGWALLFFPLGILADYYVTGCLPMQEEITHLRWGGLPLSVVYSCIFAVFGSVIDNLATVIRMSNPLYRMQISGLSLRAIVRLAAVARYVSNSPDPLLSILYRATMLRKRLMVTLKSGKVYVGEPVSRIDPAKEISSIHLLPFASGYRDVQTKRLTLVTEYSHLGEKLRLEEPGRINSKEDPLSQDYATLTIDEKTVARVDIQDIGVVIVWAEIDSMTIFDANIYAAFKTAGEAAAATSPAVA